MSLLGTITTGVRQAGQRIVISGVEKIGKTTLACAAPNPILIPMEMGYANFTIPKTEKASSFEAVMSGCEEIAFNLQRRQFPFSSIVWDSSTSLETLIHQYTLQRDPTYGRNNKTALTMEAALGGYGKAYNFANEQFGKWLQWQDYFAFEFGINVIITAHTFAARLVDPASGEYDSWDLLLHSPKNNKNYGKREMLTQWADMVGFLYEPYHVIVNENAKMSRAVSTNRGRVLGTDRTPQYVAGNRYNLTGEIPIPPGNGWNYLADAIYKSKGIDIYNRNLV